MNKQNTKLIFLLIIIGSLSNFAYSNDLQNEINSNDNMSEKVLQNTLANNPNSKTAKLLCAKIYIKNQKYNDAEKLIRQVLDEDPNNIKAQKIIN
jgi:predicted Zn-dependent protease